MIDCVFEDGGKGKLRHVVVDSLVLKNGKLLMVKRSTKLLEGGKWGLTGGFMDRDETLIQAAQREIMEETGWQVNDLTLLSIIDEPNRPNEDRQNVAFVYFGEATEKIGQPDWESDEQKWFDLEDLPPKEQIAFDHSNHIELYKRYLKEQLPLPVVS